MPRNAFTLTRQLHRDLKRSLAGHYPELSASNRAEALARGLGFRTNAALRAALPAEPLVGAVPDAFLSFARSKGLQSDGRGFGLVLAAPAFASIPPDAPRLVLYRWRGMPTPYGPRVLFPGNGLTRAIFPVSIPTAGISEDVAFRTLTRSGLAGYGLVREADDHQAWYEGAEPWMTSDDARGAMALDGHADGTPIRIRAFQAGKIEAVIDVGEYLGARPCPGWFP